MYETAGDRPPCSGSKKKDEEGDCVCVCVCVCVVIVCTFFIILYNV